ncbi:HIT family protein [Candidatus Woesearchaeota archaeon]|nr:HIT family protein [Candidatus Woesearchaeota archaeon]
MTNGCIFCKIVTGDIPAERVYENEKVYAFLDIRPINRGHALVIHKHHHADIFDTPEEDLKDLMAAAKHLAPVLVKTTKADGLNIGMNNRGAAGQVVMHAHLHVIPRFVNDGLRHWPGRQYTPEELKLDADAIRKALK